MRNNAEPYPMVSDLHYLLTCQHIFLRFFVYSDVAFFATEPCDKWERMNAGRNDRSYKLIDVENTFYKEQIKNHGNVSSRD